jgi:Pup-like protein
MATDGGVGRKRNQPTNDSDETAELADTSSGESLAHAEQVIEETDAVLDDIDDVLRASLDLEKDAPDELFAERAAAMVAGYQQKGGQ